MKDILKRIGFPKEAISFFANTNNYLSKEDDEYLTSLQAMYMMRETEGKTSEEVADYVSSALDQWADKVGMNRYTADMLFLVRCLPELKEMYAAKGLPEEMFYGIAHDLTNKLKECMTVHGVFGTFVFGWFHHHFEMKLFALGRFQYEEREFIGDYAVVQGIELHKGDILYNFHIPSSGPLTDESRIDSYKQAYDFFKAADKKEWNGNIVFCCSSWLLWPDNTSVYPENGNLISFYNDFEVLGSQEYDKFHDDWRVFGTHYTGDTSILPADTTLQRNFIKHLENGGKSGGGYGIIVFDGEKVLTRKQ